MDTLYIVALPPPKGNETVEVNNYYICNIAIP